MNASNENHDPVTLDELHDRLVDRALVEVIGNEHPPDLSARILATNFGSKTRFDKSVTGTQQRRRLNWLALAIAASLLIGASTLLLMNHLQVRNLARKSIVTETTRLEPRHDQLVERSIPAKPVGELSSSLSLDAEQNTSATNLNINDAAASIAPAPTTGPPNRSARSGRWHQLSAEFSRRERVKGGHQNGDTGVLFDARQGAAQYGHQSSDDVSVPYRLNSFSRDVVGELSKEVRESESRWGLRLGEGYRWPKQNDTEMGTGPGLSGDRYTRIIENPFIKAEGGAAVSTFSIDVDTASYSNVRQFLLEMNQLPPPDAVRIEELINYFDYDYAGPTSEDEAPFAAHVEVTGCPWTPEHRLVRIGIKGREMDRNKRPKSNLVFLVDVSGSMDEPNKLPLVVYGLEQLTRELGENDRVAIVVYASSEGLVLPSTPGSNQAAILSALGKLAAGGSTAGGAGIQLAYQIAEDNFIEGGTNRVVLCTDGDFNVGVTSAAELERLCEQKAKDTRVFLSVLGFGRGNLNDAMMEAISNRGNGNYQYVDNRTEARRVLVEEMSANLVTIAKDVKIQVEFNPHKVAGYRLVGYENRMLRTEDFNDDKKDAGEIGAGHTVTALYEVVPAGKPVAVAPVDDLKYQRPDAKYRIVLNDGEVVETGATDVSDELLTLKMRYKAPECDTSKKLEWPVTDDGKAFAAASRDCQFAAAVAGFGMLLRDSQYKGNLTFAAVLELAQGGLGDDPHGYRKEFLDIVRTAQKLSGE
jgi:Ca-activated chloride channel family protein